MQATTPRSDETYCPLCGGAIILYLCQSQESKRIVCGAPICVAIQEAIDGGEHVHEDTICYKCGDLYENECPATDPLVVDREPRLVRESEQ